MNQELVLRLIEENKELKALVEKYEEALKKYADKDNWSRAHSSLDHCSEFDLEPYENGWVQAQQALKEPK